MSTFKKAKVVMLPTNEVKGKLIFADSNIRTPTQLQHLYILSDDEIKENGTHFYNPHSGQLHISGNHTDYIAINKNGCKKIIATTDVSLSLPQPSQQFIQKYTEEYNKGNLITDVLIEYELISNEEYFGNTVNPDNDVPYFDEKLKINPKDHTITIKKVKDSWNREEILNDIEQAIIQGLDIGQYRDKWIKENL